MPITLQTFAVLLVAAAYGPVLGTASLLLYLLVGIAGVPVYAEHKHGWDVFSGATGGYIVGFVARRRAHRLPGRARVGPPLLDRGVGDAHRQRRHLRAAACSGCTTRSA